MASKSGTSKTPTTGRKTPQSFSHVRPPSPKVDLSASKSKTAPSPKPKSEYLRSKGKSPSHHERSFNNGHTNEDCEYSVRSVFDESQLAKIKVVVEKTRLNVIDTAMDDRNHFHAVPNNHHDNDLSMSYGEFGGEFIEPTPRAMISASNDDCAVSDITADAPYMAQPAKYNNIFANAMLLEADDLASLSNDALDAFSRLIQEEKAKRNRMQSTPLSSTTPVTSETPVHLSATKGSSSSNEIHNIPVPEAVLARKSMGRARSGGNEQMIRKRSSPSVQPFFASGNNRSFRQSSLDDFGDVPMGNVELSDVTPSKSVDGVDGEVERALRGLMVNGGTGHQAIQSVTPTTMPNGHGIASTSHHPVSGANAGASSVSAAHSNVSPAGVSGHPLSRGVSRGSGTYVAIDRMCHDSSFTSPLVYVESPTHTAGNVITGVTPAPTLSSSHSFSRPAAPRINNLMDPLEESAAAVRTSTSSKPAKKLESFREAKQYSDSQIDVAVVEEFQPLGINSIKESSGAHKSQGGNTLTPPPVRPIILTRTASAGSDLSAESQQLDSKTVAVISEFNTLLKRDVTENSTNASSSALNRRNRDLLVSPLCAFDDCASLESGWSMKSGGSRRSQTSNNKHGSGKSGGGHKEKGSHSASHSHKNVSHMHYTSATSSYLAKQINR